MEIRKLGYEEFLGLEDGTVVWSEGFTDEQRGVIHGEHVEYPQYNDASVRRAAWYLWGPYWVES